MAQIGNFDSDAVDPNVGFDPLPPGDYIMKITSSDLRVTKGNAANKYVWLEHTIIDGPFKNRKLYNNLNLWNTNVQAVKIAEGMLAQLCKAVGKKTISDTVELHGLMFTARVGLDTKGDRGPQNRIDKYLYEQTPEATVAATAQGAATQAGSSAAPWAR